MRKILLLTALMVVNLTVCSTTFSQDQDTVKCFTIDEAKTLLKFAEKGLKFDEVVAEYDTLIIEYDKKIQTLESKISVLQEFNSKVLQDNTNLKEALSRSEKKHHIFRNMTIASGVIIVIETFIVIKLLN